MKEIKYVVSNPNGVHARPCALLTLCSDPAQALTSASP